MINKRIYDPISIVVRRGGAYFELDRYWSANIASGTDYITNDFGYILPC